MNVNLRLFSIGVGLASLATIALELLLTRIYSVTMYYHFAFMVVSLALLGLSVSGVAIYLFPRVFTRRGPAVLGAGFMLLFAIGVVIAVRTALANPVSVHSFSANPGKLVAVYFAASLPFLFSGFTLSLAIVSAGAHIGRIYAFDLGGAALGCIAVIPAVGALGAPGAALGIAALGAFAAAILALAGTDDASARQAHRPRMRHAVTGLATVLGLVLAVLAIGESKAHRLGLARNPEKFQGNRPVLFEKWNAFSQITVTPSPEADHRWIFIDGDAATRMWSGETRTQNPEAPRRIPEVRVASLAYAIRHTGTALIVGPGGGTDVLSALTRGVPRVVGVEVNPIIVNDVMRDRFASWNGDLYRDPRVRVVVDEGRSFIRRANERFGTIQATLVDTWAASSSGAFTLSENNIYTTEAFTEFLDHLEPGGVVTVTRWYDASAPKEFLRLLALARAALERRGIAPAEAHRHVAVATDHERRGTLLLGRDPFTAADLATLRATAARDRLRLLFMPDQTAGSASSEDPLLARFLRAPNAADVLDQLPYDARATTDDRPFFFYSLRRSELLSAFRRFGRLEANNVGIAILLLLLALSVGTTVLLVALPMLVLRREALRAQTRAKLRVLAYFLGLGLGYILIEIGFMQKFVLFLGHPIYALAVVLATLLAASGAGSALSGRWVGRFGSRRAVRAIVLALSVVLLGYALGLGPLFRQMLGLPIGGRITLAALLVALPGLMMGALLPIGVRAANLVARDLVAWGWGLNGAASVVGSIAAVTLSMNFGFSAALLAGLAVYAFAAIVLPAPPPAT